MDDVLRQKLNELTERMADKSNPSGTQSSNMKVEKLKPFRLTVAELRAAAASNPEHEKSIIFEKACKGKSPNDVIVVDRNDLTAVLENKTVIVKTSKVNIGGDEHPLEEKMVVAAPVAAPTPPPKKKSEDKPA